MHVLSILNCLRVGFTINESSTSWSTGLWGTMVMSAARVSVPSSVMFLSVVVKNDSSNYILQKHMLPEKQLEEKMRQSGRIVSKRKENIKMRIGTEGTPICRWYHSSLCPSCSLNCVKFYYTDSLPFYISDSICTCLKRLAFDNSEITIWIICSDRSIPSERQLYWLLLCVAKEHPWLPLGSNMYLFSNPGSLRCLCVCTLWYSPLVEAQLPVSPVWLWPSST